MSAVNLLSICAARAEEAITVQECDYTDKATGLLMCGKCHTPKQCRPFPDSDVTVYCVCDCMKAEDAAHRQQRNCKLIEQRRRSCFDGSDLIHATFAHDDGTAPALTQCCKDFAARAIRGTDGWLLLWGDTGTGKSYMAACIANAVLDAGMTVRFVTVPEIEQQLWNAHDKAAFYEELTHTALLVIDDFGCERRTDYMDEIKFNLIDGRLRSGKPCVITTNLTQQEFAAPEDRTLKRIVSRIFERAAAFHVQGKDRRFEALRKRNQTHSKTEEDGSSTVRE